MCVFGSSYLRGHGHTRFPRSQTSGNFTLLVDTTVRVRSSVVSPDSCGSVCVFFPGVKAIVLHIRGDLFGGLTLVDWYAQSTNWWCLSMASRREVDCDDSDRKLLFVSLFRVLYKIFRHLKLVSMAHGFIMVDRDGDSSVPAE